MSIPTALSAATTVVRSKKAVYAGGCYRCDALPTATATNPATPTPTTTAATSNSNSSNQLDPWPSLRRARRLAVLSSVEGVSLFRPAEEEGLPAIMLETYTLPAGEAVVCSPVAYATSLTSSIGAIERVQTVVLTSESQVKVFTSFFYPKFASKVSDAQVTTLFGSAASATKTVLIHGSPYDLSPFDPWGSWVAVRTSEGTFAVTLSTATLATRLLPAVQGHVLDQGLVTLLEGSSRGWAAVTLSSTNGLTMHWTPIDLRGNEVQAGERTTHQKFHWTDSSKHTIRSASLFRTGVIRVLSSTHLYTFGLTSTTTTTTGALGGGSNDRRSGTMINVEQRNAMDLPSSVNEGSSVLMLNPTFSLVVSPPSFVAHAHSNHESSHPSHPTNKDSTNRISTTKQAKEATAYVLDSDLSIIVASRSLAWPLSSTTQATTHLTRLANDRVLVLLTRKGESYLGQINVVVPPGSSLRAALALSAQPIPRLSDLSGSLGAPEAGQELGKNIKDDLPNLSTSNVVAHLDAAAAATATAHGSSTHQVLRLLESIQRLLTPDAPFLSSSSTVARVIQVALRSKSEGSRSLLNQLLDLDTISSQAYRQLTGTSLAKDVYEVWGLDLAARVLSLVDSDERDGVEVLVASLMPFTSSSSTDTTTTNSTDSVPASPPLPPATTTTTPLTSREQEQAVAVIHALACAGFARAPFRLHLARRLHSLQLVPSAEQEDLPLRLLHLLSWVVAPESVVSPALSFHASPSSSSSSGSSTTSGTYTIAQDLLDVLIPWVLSSSLAAEPALRTLATEVDQHAVWLASWSTLRASVAAFGTLANDVRATTMASSDFKTDLTSGSRVNKKDPIKKGFGSSKFTTPSKEVADHLDAAVTGAGLRQTEGTKKVGRNPHQAPLGPYWVERIVL